MRATEGSLVPGIGNDSDGGPLARELLMIRMIHLLDVVTRSGSLAYPRISGFSDFEWRVLARACETPPLSINDLGILLHRGVAQVSRTVKKLVRAGLLHRTHCGGGPGVAITPTDLGQTVYEPLVELARQRNAELVSGLSTDDLRTLDHCVRVMMRNSLAQLSREHELRAEQKS
ncbi:MAG TPA: MarR family transcriptional regulator [Steroidobacteraceae bacterium]|jgi:DNA-binding MarR family transcriptional regulator